MPKAKYQSNSLRGFKKHNEGYHRPEKRGRGRPAKNNNPGFTQDDSLRAISDKEIFSKENTERDALLAAHKALNILQKEFRRIYCKGCIVHRAGHCDGSLCRVAVEIIPKKDTTRTWRPMPSPDYPLPVDLGKPKGGARRIIPKKVPGL